MHRRAFLCSVGAAAVAGCAGDDRGAEGPDPTTDAPTATQNGATTADGTPTSAPAAGVAPPHKGVSLSPRSFESADFQAFVEQAVTAGTALRWAGDWAQLGEPSAPPAAVARLARDNGLAAIIDTGVYSVSDGALNRPLTAATRRSYVDSAADFAAEHAPAYLGIGVEVNIHAEEDPDSFNTFVDLFAETRAAVADAAPKTRVYVTFQYEHLQGLRGGLFGGENDPDDAQWTLLDRFPDSDLVGLTTYPGLVYPDPIDVPADYFSPIADRVDQPLAITETGWTVDTIADGWSSDEAEQAAFVRRLFSLVEPLDLELLCWLWLYEQPTQAEVFRGMTLRRDDGSARPAWNAWLDGEL